MFCASDVVVRYGANDAAAMAAVQTCVAPAAAAIVPFWQSGEKMVLEAEDDERASAAAAIPSNSPSNAGAPALFRTLPAGETKFNLANSRVAVEEAVNSGHVEESAARTIFHQVAAHASNDENRCKTPLHLAAALGQERIVTVLLLKGADVNAVDGNGHTPLHLAVEHCHLSTVKVILAANPDMSIRYKVEYRRYSVLDLAAREGDVDILRALLQHGVGVNKITYGYTSLHIAALNNRVGAIDVLIEAGADIEVEDDDGCTAFLNACSNHCHEAALALFRHGANIEARDFRGETPLQTAARQAGREGVTSMVNLLLTCGSDELATNPDGHTAADIVGHHIEYAACPLNKEDVERVRELLANAPADRAWRRRGYLILCKSRFMRTIRGSLIRQNQKIPDCGQPPDPSCETSLGDTHWRWHQGGRPLGGCRGETQWGARSTEVAKVPAADVFGNALVRVLVLAEEGLFRNIVSFL